jgi:hypothetical protein
MLLNIDLDGGLRNSDTVPQISGSRASKRALALALRSLADRQRSRVVWDEKMFWLSCFDKRTLGAVQREGSRRSSTRAPPFFASSHTIAKICSARSAGGAAPSYVMIALLVTCIRFASSACVQVSLLHRKRNSSPVMGGDTQCDHIHQPAFDPQFRSACRSQGPSQTSHR